jgi:hypothetical protein
LVPANLMHSSLGFPSTRVTAKAEVKVSPAPVVSITSVAGIIGCLIGFSPSTNRADPCDPSLTNTSLTPCTSEQTNVLTSWRAHVL